MRHDPCEHLWNHRCKQLNTHLILTCDCLLVTGISCNRSKRHSVRLLTVQCSHVAFVCNIGTSVTLKLCEYVQDIVGRHCASIIWLSSISTCPRCELLLVWHNKARAVFPFNCAYSQAGKWPSGGIVMCVHDNSSLWFWTQTVYSLVLSTCTGFTFCVRPEIVYQLH